MKKLLLALPLVLCACVSTPGTVPMEAPVIRTIERVLDRHDAYVIEDASLDGHARAAWLADSSSVRTIIYEVRELTYGAGLSLLDGPMSRHDAYVRTDMDLDPIEVGIYLESTARLRSLFNAVQ